MNDTTKKELKKLTNWYVLETYHTIQFGTPNLQILLRYVALLHLPNYIETQSTEDVYEYLMAHEKELDDGNIYPRLLDRLRG